jgi:hypothetical protein
MVNNRKMLKEKEIRDMQMMEMNGKKQNEKSQKKAYEKQLVTDLKTKISTDKEQAVKKKEDYKVLAWDMFRENETNKQMRMDEKQRIRELDVKLSKDYIAMVDAQERKKKEEFQAREQRIAQFMGKMEKSVVAEENKKQKLIEDTIRNYEEKRLRLDMVEDERRKKAVLDRQQMLKDSLRD